MFKLSHLASIKTHKFKKKQQCAKEIILTSRDKKVAMDSRWITIWTDRRCCVLYNVFIEYKSLADRETARIVFVAYSNEFSLINTHNIFIVNCLVLFRA